MQEALGLKVSQFVGLMGDRPQSAEEAELSANYARRHVEHLAAAMDREKTNEKAFREEGLS
jgi:hypothetical protein